MESLQTLHGAISLPAFFPDGTRAVVVSVDSEDIRQTATPGIVMNTFHLLAHPGIGTVKALGGLHKMTGWNGPILSDSGGFQVFSLITQGSESGVIRPDGVIFRRQGFGKTVLTPQKAIALQLSARSDIVTCLDWCTHPDASDDTIRDSVRTTIRWAEMSRRAFDDMLSLQSKQTQYRPMLFGVIQGGTSIPLRYECARALRQMDFDGYGYGGWPLDRNGNLLIDTLARTAELMPDDKPKYAMGIGKPEEVVACTKLGYNLFDCAIPTRDARHHRLYTFTGASLRGASVRDFYSVVHIQDDKYIRDRRPISALCDCHTCRNYSRAYLHHLFHIRDPLALRLATIHNLRFYSMLMERIRSEVGDPRTKMRSS